MGGTQSKLFFRAMKEPNEDNALKIYRSSEEFKELLDPNHPYGLFSTRSITPLHLTAKRGFVELFKLFMINGGNATYVDRRKQTVVHHVCTGSNGTDPASDQKKAEMLQFLIDICTSPDRVCPDKKINRQLVNLNGQDRTLNTPLHLAAGSGLVQCVQILIDHGAIVHIANIAGQTAFKAAEAAGHSDVVALLEPKMVFTITPESALIVRKPETLRLESYQGMPTEDIQAVKRDIIQHTASILDLPLTATEQLLQHYSWSQQLVVDAWLDDPLKVCDNAKIKLPVGRQTSLIVEQSIMKQSSKEEHICEICGDLCLEVISNVCGDGFCRDCWQEYLRSKVTEGKVVKIPCPGYGCDCFVLQEMVMKLLPTDINSKFDQFDIGAFIEANPNTRWCPHPGCERAVHLKLVDAAQQVSETPSNDTNSNSTGSNQTNPRNVDCGMGHFFCWSCSEEAHDPCSCEVWKAWKERIQVIESGDLSADNIITEKASSEAWLAKYSKPCPKCKRPIQRNDGCNHMTCSKCNHEFCWVCLGRWAIHGSRTGGYYQCNRFRAAKRVSDHLDALKQKAEAESKKKNMRYFKHVYSRYTNHMQSFEFEEKFLTNVSEKMAAVLSALTNIKHLSANDKEGKFARDAIRELLKSRLVLRASYALSYYLETDSDRNGFVKQLAPVEKSTETLAQIIARPHLSTPKDRIVLATIEGREIRRQFLLKARSYNINLVEPPPLEDPEDDDVVSDHSSMVAVILIQTQIMMNLLHPLHPQLTHLRYHHFPLYHHLFLFLVLQNCKL